MRRGLPGGSAICSRWGPRNHSFGGSMAEKAEKGEKGRTPRRRKTNAGEGEAQKIEAKDGDAPAKVMLADETPRVTPPEPVVPGSRVVSADDLDNSLRDQRG